MKHVTVFTDPRSASLVTFAGMVLFSCCAISAQERVLALSQELEAPIPLRTADGKIIESHDWSVPTVADIDGDGRQDLVVGQFMNHKVPLEGTDRLGSAGTVRWYRNGAKLGAAQYAPGVDLKCDDGLLYAANW